MSDPERLVGARARTSLSSPPPASTVRGARFLLLQQEKAPAELQRLPIEGAAQRLLVHAKAVAASVGTVYRRLSAHLHG